MVMFGMIVSFVSFAFGLFVILEKLISNSAALGLPDRIDLVHGGVIVFCLGIIGIYVSRIFVETKNRPTSSSESPPASRT